MRALLERVVRAAGAAARARARCRRAGRGGSRAVLALRLEPSTATEHARRQGLGLLPGDRALPRDASATTRSSCSSAATSPNLVLTDEPRPAARARGLPVGQQAEGPGGAGRPEVAVRAARAHEAGARSSTGRARSSTRRSARSTTSSRRSSATRSSRRQRAASRRRASWRKAQGHSKAEQEQGSRTRPSSSSTRSSRATCCRSTCKYGLGLNGLPRIDDPDFVSALVFDPSRGATTPKARFAYLFPRQGLGGDPGAAQAGPDATQQRGRAIELVRDGRGDAGVAAQERRELHGDRRAGAWSRTSTDALTDSTAAAAGGGARS